MPAKFVSMELTKAERAEAMPTPAPPDGPRYSWGLAITLDNDALEKLEIEKLPAVGGELVLVAKVKVTRVESREYDTGKSQELGLQITHLALDTTKRATADVLFGGKK